MYQIQVYPVLDGLEVRITGACVLGEPGHVNHTRHAVQSTINPDRISEMGLASAIALECTLLIHEHSDLLERARC
jgi:hypothetical protein